MSILKQRLLCLSLLIVALDQGSKWLVEERMTPLTPLTVIPDLFDLLFVTNSGIAFGLFRSHGNIWGTALLAALGLIALTVVGTYFARTPESQRWLLTALALVLGGAIGNLTDRVLLGEVTDFFDFYIGTHHWPTFNIADSAISVGIVLLALDALLSPRSGMSPSVESAELES